MQEKGKQESRLVKALTEILSGLVNGILMFVFCYVFSSLVFGPPEVGLQDYVPLGAGTNTLSAFVVGLSVALYSDCAVSIAGPDINPTIFLAQMAVQIGVYVDDKYTNISIMERNKIVLSTILFAIIISSAIVGVWFYFLGRFRLTRIVQFVPAAVLSGFLASVGVIIMIKAVKASVGDELSHHPGYWQFWALLAPAVPIGVTLYCSKRFHIGSPIWMVPLCLFGPFMLFYIIVFSTGNTMESVRANNLCKGHGELYCGWLYDEYNSELLINQWVMSYGSTEYIEWAAIGLDIPIMFIMLIIVTLDSLLKISGTKKQLGIHDLDYDHEVQLFGKANMALPFLVGAPAYSQLKFNALNYGIIHNTESRAPGIIAAFFNGALFLAGFPLINYLPRFFVGAMLIYAGIGFVVENLLDTWIQNRLSLFEYLTVVVIVVLSQVLSMLVAVIVGIMLSFVLFVVQYSKTGVIKAVLSGKDYQSYVIRSTQEDAKLEHLSSQVVIVKLKRYIFFGSANQISDLVHGIVWDESDILADSEFEKILSVNSNSSDYDGLSFRESASLRNRVSTIVFDFEDVYGIDFSACGIFSDLIKQLVESNREALQWEVEQRHRAERQFVLRTESGSGLSHRSNSPSPSHRRAAKGSKSVWETNGFLRMLKDQFGIKKNVKTRPRQFTLVFCGMSDRVYRRLKSEGIVDLVHLSGTQIGNLEVLNEVLPKILEVPRITKLTHYVKSVFGRMVNTQTGKGQRRLSLSQDLNAKKVSAKVRHPSNGMGRDFVDEGLMKQSGVYIENSAHSESVPAEIGPVSSSTGLLNHDEDSPKPQTTADYYRNQFPTEFRRVFPTLDLAMEWVEERLLAQASTIRQRWLSFFDSFRTLHEQARLKAQYEPFEHILGGHLGDAVWKYILPIHVPEGCYLCRAGDINPHLFLLQHGRLTSYMTRTDESLIRLQTHRRGAFINEDALFVEYPLSHTVIADEDSVVLALSRENLKLLEAKNPEIAFEIHRDVLTHTARVRNRLARELDVVDHWALHERISRTEGGGAFEYHQFDTVHDHKSFHLGSRSYSGFHGRSSSHHAAHHSPSRSSSPPTHSAYYSPPLSNGGSPRQGSFSSQVHSPLVLELHDLNERTHSPTPESSSALHLSSLDGGNGGLQLDVPHAPVSPSGRPAAISVQQLQSGTNMKALAPAPNAAESHLKSTSRSVGRVILKQANRELEKEVARSAQNQLEVDEGEGGYHEGDEDHVYVKRNSLSDIPSPRTGNTIMDEELSPEIDLRLQLSDTVNRIVSSSQTVGPQPTSSGAKNQKNLLSIKDLVDMRDAYSNVDQHGHAANDDPGELRLDVMEPIRRAHSNIFDHGLRRSPLKRNPSMCFRPELQRQHFLGSRSKKASNTSVEINIVDAELVRSKLHLSQVQKIDAIACLRRAASNRFYSRGKAPLSPNSAARLARGESTLLAGLFEVGLPKGKLSQTLMDMGHFPSEADLSVLTAKYSNKEDLVISEENFLQIVRDVSLEILTNDHIQGFALFFNKHAKVLETEEEKTISAKIAVLPDRVLTVDGLDRVLKDLNHAEDRHRLAKMIADWSDLSLPPAEQGGLPIRVLKFVSLCSLMAYHLKAEKLDEQVARDFSELTQEKCLDDIIMTSDILSAMHDRGIPCTVQEAADMIFEADVNNYGGVSYDDLVETLTTVFESEIVPQLEQITQNLIDAGPSHFTPQPQ